MDNIIIIYFRYIFDTIFYDSVKYFKYFNNGLKISILRKSTIEKLI